jgi:hypothetical protein
MCVSLSACPHVQSRTAEWILMKFGFGGVCTENCQANSHSVHIGDL